MTSGNHEDDHTQSYVALTAGTLVLHYKIVNKIGAGGMGEVYLAEDTKLNRRVALKFLPSQLCEDEECRKRFTREAQAAAGLDHPNIAAIYEVSEYQSRPFYSMQVVEGQSLKDVISGEDLSIERILEIAIQVCEGLQAAHEQGIIHRDIKPSNLLIDGHGRVRIVDFGLATMRGSEHLTRTGSTLGTIGYMSPEQVQGREIDRRSDLFSLGVVLYELVTKRNPFMRDNEAATFRAVTDYEPEPLMRYKANVPKGLQEISVKLLEKEPAHRYQSAAGVLSDLRRCMTSRITDPTNEDLKPSIAVLPFSNLSADPEQEYFCDGMAEEIINALTHVEGVRVVARTSCFAFKGKHEDIRDIGRKLNVDHVLEGSIRKSGNRVRITGQLIKISDGFHLWSDKFDRNLEDIFEIQDEISQAIARKLQVKLIGAGGEQLTRRPTDNLEAYNHYLRGRHFWDLRTKSSLFKSVSCFERAIELDSTFALGYAGLADAHLILADHDYSNRHDHLKQAENQALAAIEINKKLAEPHATLGTVKFDQWKWSEAEGEFKRAIEINPGYPTAHQWYGLYLIGMGRLDEAREHLSLARELDPISLALIMAQAAYFYTRRHYDQAIDVCREGMELAPNGGFPMIAGWSLIEKGDYQTALEQLNRASELYDNELFRDKPSPDIAVFMGRAYALMGNIEEARHILDDCLKEADIGRLQPATVAVLYVSLGDADSGMEWLERSLEDRDFWFPTLSQSPVFDSIRDDPRFVSLLSQAGLPVRPGGVSNE
jgi:TolB-like protein/Tfp pilus assembly protein PilF/predicted Ser/Thr protein kinase